MAHGRRALVGLLGSWFIGFGVLRHRHIQRGKPLKITGSMMHAFCHKGKQKTLRAGFYYAISSTFLNGWDWTAPWLEVFQSLPPQAICLQLVFRLPWQRVEFA